MSSSLPPLKSLVVFEQCARFLSFSRAADELGITQSAVSRHILNLEASIGTKLFNRSKQGVCLTSAGELCAEDISRIMSDIVGSTERLRSWVRPRQVTIAALTAVADMWLLPRLQPLLQARQRNDVKCVELAREELIAVSVPGSVPLLDQEQPVLISIDGKLRDLTDWEIWLASAKVEMPPQSRRWRLGTQASK